MDEVELEEIVQLKNVVLAVIDQHTNIAKVNEELREELSVRVSSLYFILEVIILGLVYFKPLLN